MLMLQLTLSGLKTKVYDFAYEKWLQENYKLKSCALNPDILRYTNQTEFEKCGKVGKTEESELENFIRDSDYFDPRTEAKFLFTKVSFLNGIFSPLSILKESTMFLRNLRLHCIVLYFTSPRAIVSELF